MQGINLIPAQRREAKRLRNCLRRWLIACTLYATLLAIVSVLCRTNWSDVDRTQAHQLAQVAARINAANEVISTLTPQLAHVRLTLAIEQQIVNQPNWSILLALLGRVMGDQIVLRECELRPIGVQGRAFAGITTSADGSIRLGAHQYMLRLKGLGRSQREVSQFVLRLEKTQLFSQVKLIKTMRQPVGEVDVSAFEVECVIGSPPSPVALGKEPTP